MLGPAGPGGEKNVNERFIELIFINTEEGKPLPTQFFRKVIDVLGELFPDTNSSQLKAFQKPYLSKSTATCSYSNSVSPGMHLTT